MGRDDVEVNEPLRAGESRVVEVDGRVAEVVNVPRTVSFQAEPDPNLSFFFGKQASTSADTSDPLGTRAPLPVPRFLGPGGKTVASSWTQLLSLEPGNYLVVYTGIGRIGVALDLEP